MSEKPDTAANLVVRKVLLRVVGETENEAGQRTGEIASQEFAFYENEFHLSLRELLSRVQGVTLPPEPAKESE